MQLTQSFYNMKLRAINLGGWFVLERWMDEELFFRNNVEGNDETVFSVQTKNKEEELNKHYDSFITFEDLKWIKSQGVNLVRLPIPWWLFGEGVYHRSVEYIDRAISWFEELDLDYMLDLHTAPGCQNGFDNGGIQYQIEWHNDPKNITKTIEILEVVANRYKGSKNFHSIQLLNEPHISIDINILKDFYLRSYIKLRNILKDTYIVMHDGFRLSEWKSFFENNAFHNVILDTHMYQCFGYPDKHSTLEEHLTVAKLRKEILAKVSAYVPVIVGEWSLGLSHNEHINKENEEDAMTRYASAQLKAMSECAGHVFWSYRVKKSFSGWCFRDLVERGIIDMKQFLQ